MMIPLLRRPLVLACLLCGGAVARAQQPAAPSPAAPPAAVSSAPEKAPASLAPLLAPVPLGPPDPRTVKDLEYLLNQKFNRDPNDVFQSLERGAGSDLSTLNAPDRFNHFFRLGDWSEIRRELLGMPAELARKIYDKMLADLTEKPKPNVRLDDVLALADLGPDPLNWEEVHRLGQLLSLTVPATETYWLAARLEQGTEKLGGHDPANRLLTGRILLAGGFKDLARAWLPPLAEAPQIADEGVRNEVTTFLSTQQEGDWVRLGQAQRVWDENLRLLVNPSPQIGDWDRQRAAQAIAKVIAQLPPATLAPVFVALVKDNPQGAVRLLGGLGRKVQNERNGELPARVENLQAQATLANALAGAVEPGTQPWSQFFDLMADAWASEAENTFTQKMGPPNNQQRFIPPEDLLDTAPAGKWAAALSSGVRERVDASVSRTILAGANFEQAADRIVEIGRRNAAAGVALAEDFLEAWAKSNNPQLPEPLRKKYELSEDARIPVTPMMMEKNVESLSRMMALFKQAGLAPRDPEKVVSAFDLAYSSAEAYRQSHIEKVFGPLEQLDERVFLLILSRMSANLSERWRKMDVQRAGLTERDEAATLAMVRDGYAAALHMIESWQAAHSGSWRALTLAGTLLSDWGDFEYFQELVTTDARKRMAGYKEKNLLAQDYFQRGAEAYAATVPKLTPGDYSVEAYLGWFNGLLGIGSGGQINLSKAMNRAALTKIREHLQALPGPAAQAHLDLFAKAVNARAADEREPLPEDLRYRYLASALVVAKDDPFSFGTQKKVAYFDELLSEIRLQTRVDGPDTIGRDQDFGIIVSVIHTEAMGRVAKFGQYLTNDPGSLAGKSRQRSPLVRKMRSAQGPRDELELGLTETLSPFFDIQSITFASPDVKPRPTAKTGWEETVLAYVLVRAKDASVDRIPPVEMELKFIDLTGPVTIPAESAETVIKIAEGAPPRPASQVEITETLDTRQLAINGGLALEIKGTAHGLVPDLEQLVDLEPLKKAIEVKSIDPHQGLQIKELNTWGEQVTPTSERLWTIALNGDPIRAAEGSTDFHFPLPKATETAAKYQTYNDMNLAALPAPEARLGPAGAAGAPAAAPEKHLVAWLIPAAALVALAGLALFLVKKGAGAGKGRASRALEAFQMPRDVDGFAVVALLRRLRASPDVHLHDPQRAELQADLQRVQQACFGTGHGAMSDTDLRGVAEKWLRLAH